MGVMIEPTGNSGFNHSVAKFNFNTGEIKTMPYKHPDIDKKRVCFALSMKHGIYVECYHYQDLMTILDIDGNLKYNINGREIKNETRNHLGFYSKVVFYNDKILALYSAGKDQYSKTERGFPTQFMIFNTEGDYIQTIETEYSILDFCYDEDNNRIIMNLDEEIQFAYLNLAGIIK